MKIISKKNIYLLPVFVISLLLLVIVPTYAKFPSNYATSDNMIGLVLNFDVSITSMEARGGYSDEKKKVLMCAVPTIQYYQLKEVIQHIDKDVFFLITDTYEIYGGM